MSDMCICGHDKWSHAISLKGVVGSCMKEIIKGWEYCDCKRFLPEKDEPEVERSLITHHWHSLKRSKNDKNY